MREYELVGGPSAGTRLTVQPGVSEIVIPLVQPLEVSRKIAAVAVVPIRREPSYERAYYRKAGDVYRWDGLIEDAWCDMAVSYEAMADGGPLLRRLLRDMVRKKFEHLAPDKELDRIVWRLRPDGFNHLFRLRAYVGPRRIELALRDRAERRAAR